MKLSKKICTNATPLTFLHAHRPLDPNEVKLITDVMQDLHGSFKVRACPSVDCR